MKRLPYLASVSLICLLAACTSAEGHISAPQGAEQGQIDAAQTMRKSGNAVGAIALLRKAEAENPDRPPILTNLGYALISAGKPQEAVQAFDKVIALEPSNAMAYNGKAVAFDYAGNHLAAQEIYQQALGFQPNSLAIENNMAMSLILNNQIKPAVLILEAITAQPGATPAMRQNLALAYALGGEKDKALAINRQDLPEEQAQENMQFYEKYARKKLPRKSKFGVEEQIGFPDSSEEKVQEIAEKSEAAQAKQMAKAAKQPPEDWLDDMKQVAASPASKPVELTAAGEEKAPANAATAETTPPVKTVAEVPPAAPEKKPDVKQAALPEPIELSPSAGPDLMQAMDFLLEEGNQPSQISVRQTDLPSTSTSAAEGNAAGTPEPAQ